MANDKCATCFARFDYQSSSGPNSGSKDPKWHIILLYEEADKRYTGGVISDKYRMNMQFVWK